MEHTGAPGDRQAVTLPTPRTTLRAILRRLLNRSDGRLTTYHDRHRFAALMSLAPVSLPYVLALFGSDKQKPGEHSYGETYQRLFRRLRYRRLKILEIGVRSGASLSAWRAYFRVPSR